MSEYSDEEKADILAEARANIALVNAREFLRETAPEELPPVEDPVAKWRREAEEFNRMRAQGFADRKEAEQRIIRERQEAAEAAARAGIEAEIKATVNSELDDALDAVGEFVAGVRKQLRKEFAAELDKLHAELAKQRGVDAGEIIDLPLLFKRKDDAA